MQKSLIDELYYSIGERILEPEPSEEYKRLSEEKNLYYKQLSEAVGKENKGLLIAFADIYECLETELERMNFRKGFRLGMRLMMETFFGNKNISDSTE